MNPAAPTPRPVGLADPAPEVQVWHLPDLLRKHDPMIEVHGHPRIVAGPGPGAVAFDGVHDALVIRGNPLAGARCFVVEALLQVAPGGPAEQRLLHVQVDGSDDRLLLETRRADPAGTRWYADTIVSSRGRDVILADPARTHPAGDWLSLTLRCDGHTLSHAVGGQVECSAPCTPAPFGPGIVVLGRRANGITPFRGALATVRFTRADPAPGRVLPGPGQEACP